MNIPSNIITLILGISLTLISLWYGQHHGLMPLAASKDANDIDEIFNLMMTIATGLFLLVEGAIIYTVIRFRRRKGDETDGPSIEGNVPLEILWTAIPTVIVFVLAIYSFEIYNDLGGLDPASSRDIHQQDIAADLETISEKPTQIALNTSQSQLALGIGPDYGSKNNRPPLIVEVKGIQYAWLFTYPDSGITTGELHIPDNRPVKLKMTAGDVIHAFWVPQLRLKQDVIPGRESILAFTANRIGTYPIICAELCGPYHGGMKTTLHVESSQEYEQWIQNNTLAQKDDLENTLAVNTQTLSNNEFLAPYAKEFGIGEEAIATLHPHSHHLQ